MTNFLKYNLHTFIAAVILFTGTTARLMGQKDSTSQNKYKPSYKPNYNFNDRLGDPYSEKQGNSPLILPEPNNVTKTVELTEDGKNVIIREKIGNLDYRPPTRLTYEQYQRYKKQQELKSYWRENSANEDPKDTSANKKSNRIIPPIFVSPKFDRIFGGNYIDIRPNGNVTLNFGGQWQRIDNPAIPIRQQRTGGFLFDQSIALNLNGKIGEKLTVGINWDTKAAFDFDNNIKLAYKGLDHDIIKTLEAGNVSMPSNSNLIQGVQNLFGIKTQMQFGKMKVTTIMANVRGKNETINIPSNAGSQGGATGKTINIKCTDYEENRHFFLGQAFRDNYEAAFKNSPIITSNYQITRCEVYVTNRNSSTKNIRNFLAFTDMGEAVPYKKDLNKNFPNPNIIGNDVNGLSDLINSQGDALREEPFARTFFGSTGYANAIDYEIIKSARLLEEGKDYKINKILGYISLNQTLDQSDVLAVAYEYQYNGKTYKVGEFSTDLNKDGEDTKLLFLKLLKTSTINANLGLPLWDLMMKNVYNLGVTNMNAQGFNLSVIYMDDATKLPNPYILEGAQTANKNFLEMFNADNVNINNERNPDRVFDFIDKATVDADYGRVYFPVLEPFGSTLRSYFDPSTEKNLIDKYVFQALYDTTKQSLQGNINNNKTKYYLSGRVQSGSSADIPLSGLNISPSSVKVYAGSRLLAQGTDYDISPDGGRITLKPHVQNSGSDIKVSYEKADLFSFRQKSLLGSRFDYAVSKDINLGATIMHMNERPLITRVNAGDEPIRNTMAGFDVNYKKESRLLTKLVDKLPLISTKAPSMLQFSAEYAALLPGNSKVIGDNGNSFIDDFEGSRNPFDLTRNPQRWKLASPPDRFRDGGSGTDSLGYGFKRAKLAWYNIDNSFYREGGGTRGRPDNIGKEDVDEYHYTRKIFPTDIFPQKPVQPGQINETILDLAYFPEERGPYNYQTDLDANGLLKSPEKNFAGVTRAISPGIESDFDNLNVQYLDFWLMDPFIEASNNGGVRYINPKTGNFETVENTTGGKLYFNLGNVSEDVLDDNRQSFENGLPAGGNFTDENVEFTKWGVVTKQQYLVDNFSNTSGARPNQDVGYDGLSSEKEKTYTSFQSFVDKISNSSNISQDAKDRILADVSGDDFKYYFGNTQDNKKILDRYKDFNGLDGNSPDNSQSSSYVTSGTNTPDNEDLNKNNTVEIDESYFEYEISLKKQDMVVGKNHIINKVVSKNSLNQPATWYQFRIPLRDSSNVKMVGNASLKSVRFMRMYLSEFKQPIILRMAQFQLVASQWRPQSEVFSGKNSGILPEPPSDQGFSVSTVSVEENNVQTEISSKYIIPPGFQRDINNTSNVPLAINEQSLRLCVDNLKGDQIRFATKDFAAMGSGTGLNFINFESLKMFLHAESANNPRATTKEDVRAVVRFGTDLTENFYEVEIPLKLSDVSKTDERDVWPAENELDVKFSDLTAIKANRRSMDPWKENPQGVDEIEKNGKKYRVKGNPDITNVKFFMIGMYNPDSLTTKSFCIWADELRLNGYNKKPAQAAVASANIMLADLATVTLTGGYSSVGFGGIEQKVSERSQEEKINYGVNSNINLNKFIPDKVGLRLPMNVTYEMQRVNPKFDPANPDVLLKSSAALKENPDEYKKMVSPRRESKGVTFSNVQKVKTKPGAKKHFFDVENISLTAAYNTVNVTNYQTAYFVTKTYLGQANYNYSFQSKSLEPFKNAKSMNSKYLKLIKDVNISPLPSSIAIRGNMNRMFSEKQLRNAQLNTNGVDPIFNKTWTFDRSYNLRWGITKSLSFDYNADVKAIIDEPKGRISKDSIIRVNNGVEKTFRDSVVENLKKFGRVKNFNQSLTFNYKLPFDKLPLTDWVGSDVTYKVNYLWDANADKNLSDSLGNRIQSEKNLNLTSRIDLLKLYNKSKFLKKINNPPPKKEPKKKKIFKKRPDGKVDTLEVVVPEFELGKIVLQKMMMVKSININYSQTERLAISGYKPQVKYLGFDDAFKAPGLPFIVGSQDLERFKKDAQEDASFDKHWITHDPRLTLPIQQSRDVRLGITSQVDPIKDLRISINANKNKTTTYNELYKDTTGFSGLTALTESRTGNYDVTIVSIASAFSRNRDTTFQNEVFNRFSTNRRVVLNRLNNENSDFRPGSKEYAINSPQVLIPSFLAAYTGKDPEKVILSPFPRIPLPNWKIDYSGLTNIKAIKKLLPSVTISHSYSSIYRVNNYTSSPNYKDQGLNLKEEDYLFSNDTYTQGNLSGNDTQTFVPRYIVTDVQIAEKFQPLIGVQAKTKSNVTFGFKLNKDKVVSLQTTNAQISETRNTDYSFNVGFSKTGLKIPLIKVKGRPIPPLKNMTTFRLDITLRDNIVLVRKLDSDAIPSSGQWQLQIKPTINYQYSSKLTLQIYYSRVDNKPYTSGAFRNVRTEFGTKLIFLLN